MLRKRTRAALLFLCAAAAVSVLTIAVSAEDLSQLQAIYPDGGYWTMNGKPCAGHPNGNAVCGNCRFFYGYQCFGFARLLACKYYQIDWPDGGPDNSAGEWTVYTDTGLDQLRPGDVVDFGWDYSDEGYRIYGHSVWITDVRGGAVKYADCNAGNTCMIRWNVSGTKEMFEIRGKHYRIYHAPYAADGGGSAAAVPGTPDRPVRTAVLAAWTAAALAEAVCRPGVWILSMAADAGISPRT